jgi:PAS domain S-box-containing protein
MAQRGGWPVDYASANAAEVFGWSAEDFVQGHVSYAELLVADDAARVGEEVRAASEGGVSSFVHEPYRIRHRDGSVRWLHDCTRILPCSASSATRSDSCSSTSRCQ